MCKPTTFRTSCQLFAISVILGVAAAAPILPQTLSELLASTPTSATSVEIDTPDCKLNETLFECLTAHWPRVEADEEQAAQLGYDTLIQHLAPEIDANTASALTNFLPGFLSTLGLTGLDGEGLNLGFDNPLFSGRSGAFAYSVGAQLNEPQLFDQLIKSLPEEGRADRQAVLEQDLADFDSVDVRFRIGLEANLQKYRFGRNPKDYADYYQAAISAYATDDPGSSALSALSQAISGNTAAMDAFSTTTVGSLTADQRELGHRAVQLVLAQEMKRLAGLNHQIEAVSNLVNNQPQLVLDVTRRERDELTGVSQWAYELRFEKGYGNINQFASWARSPEGLNHCSVINKDSQLGRMYSGATDNATSTCLDAFLAKHLKDKASASSVSDRGKRGNRTSFSLSYVRDDRYAFEQMIEADESTVSLSMPSRDKWVGALLYGLELRGAAFSALKGNGAANMRLDFEVAYEDPAGDADDQRQDRWVGTATLSQRLTNGASVSLSAVWANRDEFLGDVDEELSARIGLKWKFDKNQ